MVINHPRIMSWNVGIIKKRLNPDSTILLQDHHHVFRKEGIEEKINLQRDDDKAKPYQVRQVRALILKHKLGDKL